MKNILLIVAFILTVNIVAQDKDEFKTIFEGHTIGGYGAFGAGYSPINNENALVFNARGGVVLGHWFALGLGGAGFLTEYQYNLSLQEKASLAGGYGGVFAELIAFGNSKVHASFPVLVGLGGAVYTTWENEGADEYERKNQVEEISTFGVFEPGVEIEFNFTKFFRLAVYANYRYATHLDITKIIDGQPVVLVSPDALNSYATGVIFKFGKF